MGKRVLGNDPFLRGAATREPATDDGGASRATGPGAPEAPSAPTPAAARDVAELPLPPPKKLPREPAGGPKPGSRGGPKAGGAARPRRPAKAPEGAAGKTPEKAPEQARAKAVARTAKKAPAETDAKATARGPSRSKAEPKGKPAPRGPRPPRRKALPRSPFDLPAENLAVPNVAVELPPTLADGGDGDDGGLLPGDLQPEGGPRVVALAPLPETKAALAPAGPPPVPGIGPATTAEAARGMLALVRRLARIDAAPSALEVDEFGRDPALETRVRPLLAWMYRRYFRVEEGGLEKLPRGGPLILVANRAGAIPWDAAMVGVAAGRGGREVRALLEDAVFHFPFLGVLVNRLGAVRACPENAERLLTAGGAVAVFPEGAGGFAKPFRDRYRVQRFGRGGFVRLALRTGATIVPVAVVGSEETYPLLGRVPARFLGVPFVPITPTWPWLGPAGLLPLPSKWTIDFGDPVDLAGLGPADAADDAKVMRIAEGVRTTVQAMLDARLAARTAVFAD